MIAVCCIYHLMNKDNFIHYHFPWLSAATLRYTEALLLSKIQLVPPVLDLGCGDGAFAFFSFERQLEFGLDMGLNNSPYLLKSYRNAMEASITDIPLDDSSVGTAISNCVMEHVNNLEQGLMEIYRVLRPGGEFALTVPSGHSKNVSFIAQIPFSQSVVQKRWLNWYNARLNIINYMTPSQWREMLTLHGFNIVETKGYVEGTTMFWHTLFASSVLFGMQLVPLVRGQKSGQQKNGIRSRGMFSLMVGRLWFWALERGYTAPVSEAEGGYIFIRCKKR